jgi:hypothetical protein
MWSNTRARQTRWGVVAGVVLLLMTFVVFSAHRSTAGRSGAAIPTATASDLSPDQHRGPPSGTPLYPYPPGAPAIAVKSATGTGPNFTIADVAAYVPTHIMPYQTPSSGPNQFVRAEFLTAAELSKRFNGNYTGRPPEALLCIAYVHGDFTVSQLGRTAHFTDGWQLFDAVTGNLLAESP